MPSQFVSVPVVAKREPLLPTPPSAQMVKLDTNLTCKLHTIISQCLPSIFQVNYHLVGGVPVHVMEVVDYPQESGPERIQALKVCSTFRFLLLL